MVIDEEIEQQRDAVYKLFCEHVDPSGINPPSKEQFTYSYYGVWGTLEDFVYTWVELKADPSTFNMLKDYVDFKAMIPLVFEDNKHFYIKDSNGVIHVFRNL